MPDADVLHRRFAETPNNLRFLMKLRRSPQRTPFGHCIEKALVFYSAALKAFTSFYDDPISDSPSAPGTQSFNV